MTYIFRLLNKCTSVSDLVLRRRTGAGGIRGMRACLSHPQLMSGSQGETINALKNVDLMHNSTTTLVPIIIEFVAS